MAASPQWKVYDPAGAYQAACKEPEAAAVLASMYGAGATIRLGHSRIVWTEPETPSDSYDHAVNACLKTA